MHPANNSLPHKQKKIIKDKRPPARAPAAHSQQEPLPIKSFNQTPEQLRKELARQALSKIEPPQQTLLHGDDFFMGESGLGEVEERKRAEHDLVAEQLNTQYNRKHHRLYENLADQMEEPEFGEGIEYKGHTLCITGFELTPQHIYSCSKDRSIIQWDRQTKKKQFLSLGKDATHHRSDILSLSLHSNHNILATAGDDCMVKLWDTRSLSLIDTLRGHKNTVNGIKFGVQSNNLCSISSDLTLKHWDFAQRGLISTYYEHNAEVLDIDYFNGQDFVTAGYDKQVIAWKTEKETKIIFKGHNYAIDRVRTINQERFITACQDGSVYLWNTKKMKPVFKCAEAHSQGWISAMDNIKQSNVFATAGIDKTVKLWGIEGDNTGLKVLKELAVKGIVTDLKLSRECLAVTECDQLRLGRWVTAKCRNKITLFPLKTALPE